MHCGPLSDENSAPGTASGFPGLLRVQRGPRAQRFKFSSELWLQPDLGSPRNKRLPSLRAPASDSHLT
eukprot:3671193-Rhodomonas_salina.2